MPKDPKILYKGFISLESHQVEGVPFPILAVRSSDSVAGLLYDRNNHRVLLIRQKRVPMEREDNPSGAITELVAGRFDVNLGPKALLVKEAKEEAGVTLREEDVVLLNKGKPMALSAGILTERCYLAYAEIFAAQVTEGDEGYGVAEEGESITRVWVDASDFINGNHPGLHECLRTFTLAQHLRLVMLGEEQ